jgi:uncharacterized protein YxeA
MKDDIASKFTTQNTLFQLDYSTEDIVSALKTLTIRNYYETLFDKKGMELPMFFVFCKEIQNKDIYIKVKIKDRIKETVFCISFHFAEHPMTQFPYD